MKQHLIFISSITSRHYLIATVVCLFVVPTEVSFNQAVP